MSGSIFEGLGEAEFEAELRRAQSRPPKPVAHAAPAAAEVAQLAASGEVYIEECAKCRGSGIYRGYSSRGRQCFACKGVGHFVRRTSPEQRAKARTRVAAKRQAEAQSLAAKAQAWREAHPAAAQWIAEAGGRGFEFARSMGEAVAKYGALTENQLAAVERCVAKAAERKAQIEAERAAREASAPTVTVAKIEEAFASAKAAGIKFPKLRLGQFRFSPAPVHGKNAGAIYVKAGEEYLGKISGGKFQRSFSCEEVRAAEVVEVASNPEAAAVVYGKQFGRCSCCGKELSNKKSIERGIGPICAEKYGW